MMLFPGMLTDAAKQANMKVPPNPDDGFSAREYPHFSVYCNTQLCRPVRWGEHWENAKVIASIPDEQIMSVTLAELIDKGFEYHTHPVS